MQAKSQSYLAELIGTFALVFFGTMSVTMFTGVLLPVATPAGILGVALAHGLVIAIMVYAIGHLSGCHINPAVTVAMMATKRMTPGDGLSYIIAQLAGASLAGWMHFFILPDAGAATNFGLTEPGGAIDRSATVAVVLEALLTFFLVWVVFATAVSGRAPSGWHGFAIGMTVTIAVLIAGPLTGAALNPARAFGPAVASGEWGTQWIYWLGPLLGGAAAAMLYTRAFMARDAPVRASGEGPDSA